MKHWTHSLPNIGLTIELPLFSVRTATLYENCHEYVVEWTRLEVRLWKWQFAFRLYYRR